MYRYLFALLMLIHGFIHFMGFAKAFHYGTVVQLTKYFKAHWYALINHGYSVYNGRHFISA